MRQCGADSHILFVLHALAKNGRRRAVHGHNISLILYQGTPPDSRAADERFVNFMCTPHFSSYSQAMTQARLPKNATAVAAPERNSVIARRSRARRAVAG